MALKDAHEVLKPYQNRLVKLNVTTKGYTIEEAFPDEEAAWLAQRKVASGAHIDLVYDLSPYRFPSPMSRC
jgi:hypothetical protein